MREQKPKDRIKNFNEVVLGFTSEEAIAEANRCLNCKQPACVKGCPVNIDIPGFISKIKLSDFKGAADVISNYSCFPAVCGRVCPQEVQCEKECILSKKNNPIKIGYLERFAADHMDKKKFKKIKSLNKKAAIIGAGPSGLTCAFELAKAGWQVTIFEGLHKAGGVLSYGIPEFRLPKKFVEKEVETLKEMGVEIKLNYVIGRIKTIDDLFKDGFNVVYIAVGSGAPHFMRIEGENLNYVYSANEFLTRINLMKAYEFPNSDTPIVLGNTVAVIGGGNTALDSARCAIRIAGVKKVYLVYRRSQDEMPARLEEIKHAQEEGVEFLFLTNPIAYKGDANKNVKKMVCVKMILQDKDASGRKKFATIPGSEFEMDIDSAIVAIGTKANSLISDTTQNLNVNDHGYIITNEKGLTSRPLLYAGGDIVTSAATVISAMGAGKKAAEEIMNCI